MKKEKEQEIKRLNNEIASIKNELAKYDEQLEECKKYKEFLDKLTPPEWFQEMKSKVTSAICIHSPSHRLLVSTKMTARYPLVGCVFLTVFFKKRRRLCILQIRNSCSKCSSSWRRTTCS